MLMKDNVQNVDYSSFDIIDDGKSEHSLKNFDIDQQTEANFSTYGDDQVKQKYKYGNSKVKSARIKKVVTDGISTFTNSLNDLISA